MGLLRKFQKLRSDRGIATVEAGLVLPLLLLLSGASIEVGRCINQYLVATRVVYEASRFAATMSGLQPSTPQDFECMPGAPDCNVGMLAVRNRIHELMKRHGYTADKYRLTTQVGSHTSVDNSKFMTVTIQLETKIDSVVFLGVSPRSITTRLTGPYLFPDRSV